MKTASKTDGFIGGNHGFTMVELLIAVAIFAIGILTVISMQVMAMSSTRKSQGIMETVALGSTELEQLKQLTYTDAGLDPANNPQTIQSGRYRITWNVQNDTPLENVKQITMTVSWGAGGRSRQSQLIYYKADL